ncbi:MAG: hypothetical protein LBD38_00080 [Streptococcaceae bacterium]|jgi:hypothetical protein|nr:hypothetical protein [Streptococcaceae bacterium]
MRIAKKIGKFSLDALVLLSCLIGPTVFASDATSTFTLTAGELTLQHIPEGFDFGSRTVGQAYGGQLGQAMGVEIPAGETTSIVVVDNRGGDGKWEIHATASALMNGDYILPAGLVMKIECPTFASGTLTWVKGDQWEQIDFQDRKLVQANGRLGKTVFGRIENFLSVFDTSALVSGTYTGTVTFTLQETVE